MIPLPNAATVRLVALVAGIAVAGFGGWTARGWKADKDIASLRLTIAQGVEQAQREARNIEQANQGVVNHALYEQNTALAGNAARLQRELERLRNRPERPAGMSEAPRPACAGATGAELSRPDAEFLVREAARADDVRAGLVACYAVIDGLK